MKAQKRPWYKSTYVTIPVSLIGALFGFASIATLIGIDIDDQLNKGYYATAKAPLFNKKINNNS